jgi:hypothetical protein
MEPAQIGAMTFRAISIKQLTTFEKELGELPAQALA